MTNGGAKMAEYRPMDGEKKEELWFRREHLTREVRESTIATLNLEMDNVLNVFYRKLDSTRFGELLEKIDIEALKRKQTSHWNKIFLGGSEDEIIQAQMKMHRAHKAIGLEMRDYITSYLYIMNLFQKVILRRASGPHEAFKMITAVQVIVADDITRALDVYYDPKYRRIMDLVESMPKTAAS